MTIYHLSGELRGTALREAWIAAGVLHHENPLGSGSKKFSDIGADGTIAGIAVNLPESVVEINGFIYPGLLDTHTHIGMNHGAAAPSDAQMRQRLEICAKHGVTAIRDSGGQRNPNEVACIGLPKVIHCGQHIARRKRYTRYLAVEVEPGDLLAEVEVQAAKSDGWIKIIGDWIDRERGDLTPLWEADLLQAAVERAHELGVKVTVHTFAAETVPMILAAGVDGIEHGTGMSFAEIEMAREAGIVLTPTVNQISRFPEFAAAGHRFPVYQKRMLGMDLQRSEHLQMFVDAGIDLLMGSDTAEDVAERGLWVELETAVANGMPADTVMAAASWRGRELLGFDTWGAGAPADFVVYETDPEQDITVVSRPKHVFIDGIEIF
ncbi:amidohydrolase family protein [Arcanobacterium hippocoleae]|uniref:Imidazolonepropionase-like amidohydrolase n=1 Tax=Arcanobacterium hippocoleae TaxID=149017 RepID=A0ABU1T1C8_9ACTO|nr:amidohydrolase family protein [Arcanobacterium hippocoleae]MDR6939109.1 imidazolonepropionase-like amidohydrolase [Arcanobacterium hippocoleae]